MILIYLPRQQAKSENRCYWFQPRAFRERLCLLACPAHFTYLPLPEGLGYTHKSDDVDSALTSP
jgi:hypothetical protein